MPTLETYIEHTQQCESEDELFRAFDRFVSELGIRYGAYFIMSKQMRAIPPEAGLVRQNFPSDFAKIYITRNFAKFDPIIQQPLKESRPFHWGDVRKHRTLNAQQEQIFEAHKEAGLLDGLAVPVFGPMGTFAVFSLASHGRTLDLTDNQLIAIQFVCLQTHNRYFELAHINDDAPEKPLSPREKEALALVAAGLPNTVIAERLGVTENTVDTMLRRIYAKFDVNNRISAVLKGIGCGMLLPEGD